MEDRRAKLYPPAAGGAGVAAGVAGSRPLLGGGTVSAPDNSAVEPQCNKGITDCSQCGWNWENVGDKKYCFDTKSRPQMCRRQAESVCNGFWSPGHAVTAGNAKWLTSPELEGVHAVEGTGGCSISGTITSTGGTLSCTGPLSDWLTPMPGLGPATDEAILENIQQFAANFPEDVAGHDELMRQFSLGVSSEGKCLPAYNTDRVVPTRPRKCARFQLDNDVGKACRQWMAQLRNSKDAARQAVNDSIVIEYCDANKKDQACACHLRGKDPDFVKMQSMMKSPAACWYWPCASLPTQLVTMADYTASSIDEAVDCPDNCMQVISVENVSNFNASFKQKLKCPTGDPPESVIPKKSNTFRIVLMVGIIAAFVGFLLVVAYRQSK